MPIKALQYSIDLMAADSTPVSQEWLSRAKAGDVAAFEQLLRQYERTVLRVALRLVSERQDALDVAQEVFLRLHRSLASIDAERELLPWLYRVTVNLCRDWHRRQARQAAWPEDWEQADAQPNPEQAMRRAEQQRALREALLTLPEKERLAIVLRDVEGLPTEEVARMLGSSAGTIRSQISTGREKLRRLLRGWR